MPAIRTIAERFFRKLLLERHTVAFAMVVFGFALSAASFFAVRGNENHVARLRFEREAQSGAAAISLAIERSMDIAEGSGALFESP